MVAAHVWRVRGSFLVRGTALLGPRAVHQGVCTIVEGFWTYFPPADFVSGI